MRDIYDYTDIRKLEETQLNSLIKKGVIITATSELAIAMASYYPEYRVIDIHRFINAIIPEWEGNVKDIKNYVILRNVIENYVADNEVNEEVVTYLRRNAGDIWNAIKLLVEADVYPDDVEPGNSIPLKHFKKIWNYLETENEQIVLFRAIFSFELSQKEAVIKKIEEKVGELRQDIFLLGFYFITPIQERILDVLDNAGFNLIFLNCHDSNYGFATKIWEKTFFEEYRSKSNREIQDKNYLINYFGDALLGKKNSIPLEIIKHHTEFDFAEMVKGAIDKGEVVYSPDSKRCEKILKEYYPEFYNRKHLLSYPVGQYINYLHMMWNTFSNRMDLRFEYVYKCFASGWLSVEYINGRDYLYEMKLLEPYFKGCHDVNQWEERLTTLTDAKKSILGFEDREKGRVRWHRLLGNPFYNLGVYSIGEDIINAIKLLISKLIDDATFLFADDERTDLYEHFQRITEIIQSHIDKEELLEEEEELTSELLAQLKDETMKGVICPMNGIRDAIIMMIGDYFGEYESQDEETSGRKRMVLPLSMVEAHMLNNYGQKVHLVLADEFSLPGQPKRLPWPLTDSMLDNLRISERKDTQKYVNDMRSVIEDRPLSYRYLFFSFMGISNSENKPILSIEWVCNKDKKEIDVSPYVRLLNLNENTIKDAKGKLDDYQIIISGSEEKPKVAQLEPPETNAPREVIMDYLLCEKRYIYSYLLNILPRYTSAFHYSFELSNLISAFTTISGVRKEEVSAELGKLFPFLRHIELRQSFDFASSQEKLESYEYEGIEYPAVRLCTHYLNKDLIYEAMDREDEYLKYGIIHGELAKESCIYCPYSEVCLDRHKDKVELYE